MEAEAQRCGGWVVLERRGRVLGHAPGRSACPDVVAQAVLQRDTTVLRACVTWQSSTTGSLDGVPVHVQQLTPSVSAWAVGTDDAPHLLLLKEHLPTEPPAVREPFVARLLEAGPKLGPAPSARLVVLQGGDHDRLAHELVRTLGGTPTYVHQQDERIIVALDVHAPLTSVLHCARSEHAHAGTAPVPEGAHDWAGTYRMAAAASDLARRESQAIADVADPAVMAHLVLDCAADAVTVLSGDLAYPSLERLHDHDSRTGNNLLGTLMTWCRHDRDVPATAAAMHVHANTLRYRIRRSGEIAGLDLSCPKQLLALSVLAHAAYRTRSPAASAPGVITGRVPSPHVSLEAAHA